MSSFEEARNSPSTAVGSVHGLVTQQRLPPWYSAAALKRKKEFAEARYETPPWYENASPLRRQALSTAYERCMHAINRLDDVFKALKGPVEFAEPLLVEAMKNTFGATYDVKQLFFARLEFMPPDRKQVFGREATGYCYYQGISLIEAALNNFSREETIELVDKASRLVTRYDFHQRPATTFNQSDVFNCRVSVEAHRFARMCRELNLGEQYLAHVESVVKPVDPPGYSQSSMASMVERVIGGAARHQLLFAAEVALGYKDIQQDGYTLIQRLGANQPRLMWHGKPVSCAGFYLFGVALQQIIVIGNITAFYTGFGGVEFEREPCLLFVPGDPVCTLRQYSDVGALTLDLLKRLCSASYRRFFSQFISYAQQQGFFITLKRYLDPANKFAEDQDYDPAAMSGRIPGGMYAAGYSPLWQGYAEKKITLLLSNAREMVVSTDAADERARNEWLASLGSTALAVLNAASLVFPELAPVMLLIGSVQILREVATGIDAWARGNTQEAWAHVSAIAHNVALAAVGAKLLPLAKSAFMDSLAHVRCPDGNVRLYAPNLTPYQQQLSIPDDVSANAHGLFEHEGGMYLPELTNNTYYRLEPTDTNGSYGILHPQDTSAYTPKVVRTQDGVWIHEYENSLTLTGPQLMRRLGSLINRFADEPLKLERIRQLSGTSVEALRKARVDHVAIPALLADTLKRFEIDEAIQGEGANVRSSVLAAHQSGLFEQRYAALEEGANAQVSLIKRAFPQLPNRVAEELLSGADGAELQAIAQNNRLPLRLAEEARAYQQQVRLARAYEGLYRKTLGNDDTQRMVLHSLEKLPGWPSDLRIEVFEKTAGGDRLIDSIGPQGAAVSRRLIKFGPKNLYEVRDEKFAVLRLQADIYGAVQAAVLPEDWAAMKLTAADRGASLKQALEQMPLMPREELRALLKMQPVKPGYRPPMRLADGRFGYPLSPVRGVGRRPFVCQMKAAMLYPSKSIEAVDEMLGLQALDDAAMLARLEYLEQEFNQLKAVLEKWQEEGQVGSVRDRRRVSTTLQNAWRRTTPQTMAADQTPIGHTLDLSDENVGDLPPITANMDHVGVLSLSRMALTDTSLPFLNAFGRLRWLDMSNNHLTRLPEFVNDGANLTKLDLSNNAIRLTEQSRMRLEGMQGLKILKLSGNRQLGWAANVQGMRSLNQLYLAETATTRFPAGAEQLTHLARVDLHSNQITELPEYAYQHLDQINLHGNPLSAAIRARLQLDPPLNQAEWGEHISHDEALRRWLQDTPATEQDSRTTTWNEVKRCPGSDAFFTVLADTTRSAEYTSGVTRQALAQRVWEMLEAAKENQAIRESLFKTADDRITCGDGSSLEFMNLESELLAAQALEAAGAGEAEGKLIATARQLFRLKLVDAIAQRDVDLRGPGFTEQVEVFLAYRIGLADRLGLPFKARSMLFTRQANVSQTAIDAAYAHVLRDERIADDESAFFVEREFWDRHLRSRYSQELDTLMEPVNHSIDEKSAALYELSALQGEQDPTANQATKDAWQAKHDEGVERLVGLLGKSKDEILVDGAMQSAFYEQQMRQLGAERQTQQAAALQTLTRRVLEQFDGRQEAHA